MGATRDLIYILHAAQSRIYQLHGITFHEFILGVSRPINLLLLRHQSSSANWDENTRFEFIPDELVNSLAKEDIYSYGDFWWLDFEVQDILTMLSKRDVADICYLAHCGQPFRSAFSAKLQNKFVYCGHDDGWYLRLHCKKVSYIEQIAANAVSSKFSRIAGVANVPALPLSVCKWILQQADKGILITLRHLPADTRNLSQLHDASGSTGRPFKAPWEIPMYQIETNGNMDYLLNNYDALTKGAIIGHLSYDGREWAVKTA